MRACLCCPAEDDAIPFLEERSWGSGEGEAAFSGVGQMSDNAISHKTEVKRTHSGLDCNIFSYILSHEGLGQNYFINLFI